MRIQLAGISNLEDALAAIDAGVDSLGFTLRLPKGPHNGLEDEGARDIIHQLPPFASPTLITYIDTGLEAADLCDYLGIRIIQLHGEIDQFEVARLRGLRPGIKTIKSIIMKDESAIDEANDWQERVDAFLLDTFDPATGKTGATGMTHDWEISRRLVHEISRPVILAGGLNPDNVGEAIRIVRPWGVDSHTGVENEDGTFSKERAIAFVNAARHAERSL
ncbi:MAG: phosphoribosylanthranilate isomerase [Planctomycetota bacterium]|nr:phosphoribosylanthranilate isomerase [Planctomycetota bacterium]MDA1139443.1 phosphoribosylanthranilate isomerase [Planctomycetota bacterium]